MNKRILDMTQILCWKDCGGTVFNSA